MPIKFSVAVILLSVFMVSCTGDNDTSIFPVDCDLQSGDIVFRRGSGLSSYVVLSADVGGNYSHVGIVADSAGHKMIVHAVPYESENDTDRVRMETPQSFFSSTKAGAGAVCRVKCDSSYARKASELTMAMYKRGVLFDHDYDDADTTQMYCCELVRHVYARVGVNLAEGKQHEISLPALKTIRCVLPSDIYNDTKLNHLQSF